MANNYVQPGNVLTIPAPANVESGSVVIAGQIRGVAMGKAASGDAVSVALTGVYELPKVGAEDVALGAAIYFDEAEALATIDDDSGANPAIGYAVAAAGNGAATVKVNLA